ncbi:MAG: hypothetical protein IT243_03625 [Bacteroidia bacterium]|nr:hypothetical protein [Bacteroidia bacterium]
MKKIIVLALLILSFSNIIFATINNKTEKNWGYRDQNGNYKWFYDKTDTSFIDEYNRKWTKVTENKEKWDRAVTIRNANICALLNLGFDTLKVLRDVQLLNENSILFTHFSKLENCQDYIFSWKNAFNSHCFKYNARKSSKIPMTDLALKFYLSKANTNNTATLGLVKRNFLKHCFEFTGEIIKKFKIKLRHLSPENYLKNYMHLNNAIELLNEKKMQNEISVHFAFSKK